MYSNCTNDICPQALLYNPTFVLTTMTAIFDIGLIGGFTNFAPLYLEYQFNFSASTAGILFGEYNYNTWAVMVLGECSWNHV